MLHSPGFSSLEVINSLEPPVIIVPKIKSPVHGPSAGVCGAVGGAERQGGGRGLRLGLRGCVGGGKTGEWEVVGGAKAADPVFPVIRFHVFTQGVLSASHITCCSRLLDPSVIESKFCPAARFSMFVTLHVTSLLFVGVGLRRRPVLSVDRDGIGAGGLTSLLVKSRSNVSLSWLCC